MERETPPRWFSSLLKYPPHDEKYISIRYIHYVNDKEKKLKSGYIVVTAADTKESCEFDRTSYTFPGGRGHLQLVSYMADDALYPTVCPTPAAGHGEKYGKEAAEIPR
jgi:hypothetical protein